MYRSRSKLSMIHDTQYYLPQPVDAHRWVTVERRPRQIRVRIFTCQRAVRFRWVTRKRVRAIYQSSASIQPNPRSSIATRQKEKKQSPTMLRPYGCDHTPWIFRPLHRPVRRHASIRNVLPYIQLRGRGIEGSICWSSLRGIVRVGTRIDNWTGGVVLSLFVIGQTA